MQYSRSWIELESGQSVCIIRNPEKRSDATRQNYCHVFWVDHLKTRNHLYAFKKTKKQQQQYTHCKLVVGVNGSFPHRSGIVKTLHVVGFVEAAVVRQGRWSLKWKKERKVLWASHKSLRRVEHSVDWLDNLVGDRFVLQTRWNLKDWLHCETLDIWTRLLRKQTLFPDFHSISPHQNQ